VSTSGTDETYLHVYCPRAPWSCDVQVKITDGIPRSGEWAYGIKITTEKSAQPLHYVGMLTHNCTMVLGQYLINYLKIQTGSFFSISHEIVGTMEIGASFQCKFLRNPTRV